MVSMLALFCLRLATGLSAALLILTPKQINPRFYRTHFLAILGLACAGAILLIGLANPCLTFFLAVSLVSAFLGSLVWSLQGAPGGRVIMAVTTASLIGSLIAWN